MVSVKINDDPEWSVPPDALDMDMPLLWLLRDVYLHRGKHLTGTKFGCGVAACGACTVLIRETRAGPAGLDDYKVRRSCAVPVSDLDGKHVVTIEGLCSPAMMAKPPFANAKVVVERVRHAWIESQVPQCGYCQSGMIVATVALLLAKPKPSDGDIDHAITNICRCGTYPRIRAAIRAAAGVGA